MHKRRFGGHDSHFIERCAEGFCPSGKWRYASKSTARKVLRKLQGMGRAERSVYLCHRCDGWHLTSQLN